MELINAVTPAQQRLVNVVDEMAIASGMPRPTIWIVPDNDPTAFATGRAATHLCVVDPTDQRVQQWRGPFGSLFASHPPISERIARLRAMG